MTLRIHTEETTSLTYVQWSSNPGRPNGIQTSTTSNPIMDDMTRREEEADAIGLKNCADYVREWITRQRRGS